MADSDDEYDRKRRDKFRGERSSGGENFRAERREERGRREDWQDRNPFRGGGVGAGGVGRGRAEYRDFRGPRERYSPGRDFPAPKRLRPDWGDEMRHRYADPYGMYNWGPEGGYPMHGMHVFGGGGLPPPTPHTPRDSGMNGDIQTQPSMMTLKQFLDTQDDGISDSEVLQKYSEYKLDFKRQQLNEFFVAHKDEEWFKNKYHPEEYAKRSEEQLEFLQRRVEVFTEVLNNGMIPDVTIDTNQSDKLLRLLDTVVIKLEGGTDEDLKVLDEKPAEIKLPEKITEQDDDVIFTGIKQQSKPNDETTETPNTFGPSGQNWDKDFQTKQPNVDVTTVSKNEDNITKVSKAIKRKRSGSESSVSSTDSEKSEKQQHDDEDMEAKHNDWKDDEIKSIDSNDEEKKSDVNKSEDAFDKSNESEKEYGKDSDTHVGIEKGNSDDEEDEDDMKMKDVEEASNAGKLKNEDLVEDDNHLKKLTEEDGSIKSDCEEKTGQEPETIDLDTEKYNVVRPTALHRSSSIFLRNLAPVITKADIETICKRFDGFLRVAIADPLVERRWYRRGWVTFKRDVNIKEICWNLNNIRLRDCEMGAIVNRDLSRRVRPVNGITAHKTIVRNDIKICAKIAMNLDEKFKLWMDVRNSKLGVDGSNGASRNDSFCFKSNNPVLQNITDFLIEEASAEEDELLGHSSIDNKSSNDGEQIERDPQLISVLDKLILYLRIVHSVDFYNHCEYPYEDEMPNRCGIIHARGPQPQNKITSNDMQDYIKSFEAKMQSFLTKATTLDEEELKNLGCKDTEAEVEKFVQANTQELGKDKWLCPLSGKKFKGPEFIRKHILNKHAEKVDEVRKEVEYFNNFLKDPKRPQLPEHPGNNRRLPAESTPHGFRPNAYPPTYMPPYYAPPMIMPTRSNRGGFGGGRRDLPPADQQRRIIGYHDLDAPGNFDVFD